MGGQWSSCCLLQREFTASWAQPCNASPARAEPWLVKSSHHTRTLLTPSDWKGPSPSLQVPQGKTWAQDPERFPEGTAADITARRRGLPSQTHLGFTTWWSLVRTSSDADAAIARPFSSLTNGQGKTNHSASSLSLGLGADVGGCSQHFTWGKCLDTTLIEGTASPILSSSTSLSHCKCTLSPRNSEVLGTGWFC